MLTSALFLMASTNEVSCHADVKPDNILRLQGNFKLADFGFATFVRRDKISISPVGGTHTYGE